MLSLLLGGIHSSQRNLLVRVYFFGWCSRCSWAVFPAFNLTSWGYEDCQYDTKDGSYGGMLTKLLFRTLPNHYPVGSAYAHFPFLDPVYMRENVAKNPDVLKKYTWTRPQRLPVTTVIDTFSGVERILSDHQFMSAYNNRMFNIVSNYSLVRSSVFWV